MKTIKLSLFLPALLLLAGAHAAVVPDLYGGEVPVTDESPETRSAALHQILRKVMVRVGGRRDVLAAPGTAQVLQEAGALVQKFRYRSGGGSAASGEPGQKFLYARFDPAALHRAMARHGLPVWLAQRQRVLLWAATEENGVRQLLNIGEDSDLQGLLRQRAQERGLPLQLPLLDLEDRAAITAADIWSGYAEAIRHASSRYPHDVVLSARLRNLGDGRWSGDWQLWWDDRSLEMTTNAGSLDKVLASAIDQAQDRLAQEAAAVAIAPADLTRVLVEGVYDLGAYSRLMRQIGEMAEIRSLVVLEASSGRLLLGVQVKGGREGLARALEASPVLVRLSPLAGDTGFPAEPAGSFSLAQTADLSYRLTGTGTLE